GQTRGAGAETREDQTAPRVGQVSEGAWGRLKIVGRLCRVVTQEHRQIRGDAPFFLESGSDVGGVDLGRIKSDCDVVRVVTTDSASPPMDDAVVPRSAEHSVEILGGAYKSL